MNQILIQSQLEILQFKFSSSLSRTKICLLQLKMETDQSKLRHLPDREFNSSLLNSKNPSLSIHKAHQKLGLMVKLLTQLGKRMKCFILILTRNLRLKFSKRQELGLHHSPHQLFHKCLLLSLSKSLFLNLSEVPQQYRGLPNQHSYLRS